MTPRRTFAPRVARALALAASLAAALLATPGPGGPSLPVARAEEAWLTEFADVCSRTQDAMSLGLDELARLVERCDRLRPLVEKLEGPQRKVYLKRLQVCRDLYQFVLESRAAEPGK